MKILIIGLMAMHLLGCAGTYQPTASAENFRQTLSHKQAIALLETAFEATDKSFGLCARAQGNPSSVPALAFAGDTVKYIANGFEIHGEKRGKQTGTETRYGAEHAVYEMIPLVDRHLYKDLRKIRLTQISHHLLTVPRCGADEAKGDVLVTIHFSALSTAYFDIPQENLDKIIAAFMKLSPDIEIIEGLGF